MFKVLTHGPSAYDLYAGFQESWLDFAVLSPQVMHFQQGVQLYSAVSDTYLKQEINFAFYTVHVLT